MNWFKELLLNPWYASMIVFVTQLLMLYLRTINIIYTTNHKILGAVISNNGVAITWLMSMTIGLNSMLTGQWQPVVAFLLGGSIGTYWGIKNDIKKSQTKKLLND